jgi:hypothetical protein
VISVPGGVSRWDVTKVLIWMSRFRSAGPWCSALAVRALLGLPNCSDPSLFTDELTSPPSLTGDLLRPVMTDLICASRIAHVSEEPLVSNLIFFFT